MWLLYPITRIVLETIRADNPLDTAGLTISQGVSVLGLVFAVVWLYGIYRAPQRSPHATPWVPPAN
jgi:prolipoprotein diacylglyceryltransferase